MSTAYARNIAMPLVSIPMFGTVESMNISVSAGMVMAETRRQRVLREA